MEPQLHGEFLQQLKHHLLSEVKGRFVVLKENKRFFKYFFFFILHRTWNWSRRGETIIDFSIDVWDLFLLQKDWIPFWRFIPPMLHSFVRPQRRRHTLKGKHMIKVEGSMLSTCVREWDSFTSLCVTWVRMRYRASDVERRFTDWEHRGLSTHSPLQAFYFILSDLTHCFALRQQQELYKCLLWLVRGHCCICFLFLFNYHSILILSLFLHKSTCTPWLGGLGGWGCTETRAEKKKSIFHVKLRAGLQSRR